MSHYGSLPVVAIGFMLSSFLLAVGSTAQTLPRSPAPGAIIPLFDLPTAYPLSLTSAQYPSVQEQIRNTLAHYPLALDGKNFAALDLVFTEDAVANLSTPFYVQKGLSQIESTIQQALVKVLTQHAYGTQVIEVEVGAKRAKSVTYFTASHFGVGNHTGKVCLSLPWFPMLALKPSGSDKFS